MYALLVDIGNTSLKIGLASKRCLLDTYTLPTDVNQSGDSLGFQLRDLLTHAGVVMPRVCILSSVVPGMNPLFIHACQRFFGLDTHFAHEDFSVPLENHYELPKEVGVDRLVASYAARQLMPEVTSVISVDYGTATTFDCVTGNAYLGGLICPGVMSSLRALATKTAQLPKIALKTTENQPIIGRNTITSLNHGFLFGFVAMTEGLCTRLTQSLPGSVGLVATGGFAADVARVTSCFNLVRPDLILEGLRMLWLKEAFKK